MSQVTQVTQVSRAAKSSARILHIYLIIYMCSKNFYFYGLFFTCDTYSWEGDPTSVALTEASSIFFMPLRVFCFLFGGAGGRGVLRI